MSAPFISEKVAELTTNYQNARAAMIQSAKTEFATLAKLLFETHPRLSQFSWRQYTPYWNDGDACSFSANTEYPRIKLVREDAVQESLFESSAIVDGDAAGYEEDDDDENMEVWVSKEDRKNPTADQKIYIDVIDFLAQFTEDMYLEIFGDHVTVTISRSGGISVQEYDHE